MLTLNERSDEIESQIIIDFENDATGVIDALIGYLQEIKKGDHEEVAILLDSAISNAINCPFDKRHKPINIFIKSAIRWQAEQIAIEEEKLTRPTQD